MIEIFTCCGLRSETQETVEDLNFSPFTGQVEEMRYLDAEDESTRKTSVREDGRKLTI